MTTRVFGFREVTVSLLLALLALTALAQSPPQLAFDVASVRVASAGTPPRQRITDTRVEIVNMPMRSILLTAFRLAPIQLVAPDSVDRTRIDIQAVIPAGRPRRDVPEMLQALLRDRFGLATRTEPRPLSVYELHVVKGGLKMTEVQPLDELTKELQRADQTKSPTTTVSETVDGPILNAMISLGVRTATMSTKYDRTFTERGTQIIDAERMSIAQLVSVLTTTVDQLVVDKTGLAGVYKFRVELPQDAASVKRLIASGITTTVRGTPLTDPSGVSVFKAVEALGLKLEQRRSPVDVVVVDRLNTIPTPN